VPKLPAKALLALALTLCCTAAPAPARTATTFVVATELSNGRVEITVAPAYAVGSTVSVPVAIVATRGSITGPLTARILASGINEGGAPAEVLVRELAANAVTVTAGSRRSTTLTWDTRDAKGVLVPADAYSLVLGVRSDDGGTSRTLTAGATLELR
jgi:hypothetical protein